MSGVYHSLATSNFTQDWTDASLITVNDDWSGVPSIIGYLGDYAPTSSPTGVDPQTLLTNGVNPTANMLTIDVIAPVIIGSAGRSPSQTTISDANFAVFDPAAEALDFWESLEGMLVTVDNPIAVAGTSSFSGSDELWVVAQGAFNSASLNSNGGLTIAPLDFNPERIQIDDLITSLAFPDVTAGATLGDITGVVNYSFTNYEILTGTTPTVLTLGILLAPEVTTVTALPRQLTVANYNFENLDPSDGVRFSQIAGQIVTALNNPIIIGGQEIQDNSGATNDGTTSASLTASTLISAITAAGGSTYSYIDVAPANNTSGGEPNGNIRPGFFYRSDIVQIVGAPITLDVAAFTGSRDPLVVTFRIIETGVEFTLINNHFSSKGGDNGLQGNVQPPVLNSEVDRTAQAQAVNDYVDGLLAANPAANIVVMGDLNDFTYSLPVQTLMGGAAPVLSGLPDALIPLETDRYSYIFNGNSQELDHMFASANALSVATAFDIIHANADFGRLQISDHDPSIALFDARQLAEVLLGTSGIDTILGFGGNDRLDGGTGSDTLSGDAGDDSIVYDAADTEANVTGGLGTDTLVVNDQALPLSFNLMAQGFERGQLNETDAALAFNWLNRSTIFNTTWQKTSVSGTYDNLDSWATTYTTELVTAFRYNDTGTNDWAYTYYQQNLNTSGVLLTVTGLNDDGTAFTTTLDHLETHPWASLTNTFSSPVSNIIILQNGTFDGGDTWVSNFHANGNLATYYYVDAAPANETYTNYLSSYTDANLLISTVGLNNNGSTFVTSNDYLDASAISSTTTTLNGTTAILQSGTYDSLDTWVSTYHANGNLATFTYSDSGPNDLSFNFYMITYDLAGVAISIEGQYDDNSTWFNVLP